MRRLWFWAVVVGLATILLLPMPLAERFTSPTQDGQYLTNPVRAYGFVVAAARVSDSSALGHSGAALERARQLLSPSALEVVKVELLFFPAAQEYVYRTRTGATLKAQVSGPFVWEVWARPAGAPASEAPDVVALLDYRSGSVLSSLAAAP